MKRRITWMAGIAFSVMILLGASTAFASHRIVIPYSYVGDGWDTVLIISNTSGETINPIIFVQNGDVSACKALDSLEAGQMFVSTFGAITGWNVSPPIPGIFQVYITDSGLGETDAPFGAAVAINNSSFGGFGFQQFMSEYSGSATFICVNFIPPIIPIPIPIIPGF
ncbi:hypothetical protein [Desulfoferrobacter suflitae]|uniref:hypothetical protein n=1 Tax=Desulfoferrobacter suflitae TaxID=2865782 RepID=UPI002164DD22|nr:hypothetical protein [Desulfoferrobacter suflitae]MCK8600164.1 hypothetical protein [Desulfoferrobacter suflitae]